jgi:hypothetical protein
MPLKTRASRIAAPNAKIQNAKTHCAKTYHAKAHQYKNTTCKSTAMQERNIQEHSMQERNVQENRNATTQHSSPQYAVERITSQKTRKSASYCHQDLGQQNHDRLQAAPNCMAQIKCRNILPSQRYTFKN